MKQALNLSLSAVLWYGGLVTSAWAGAVDPLLEKDWRMHDGIGTARNPQGYPTALGRLFARGDALLADLTATGADLGGLADAWRSKRQDWRGLADSGNPAETDWEALWRETH
jgi:hypothetical protein